jgi:hypothetical protein
VNNACDVGIDDDSAKLLFTILSSFGFFLVVEKRPENQDLEGDLGGVVLSLSLGGSLGFMSVVDAVAMKLRGILLLY